MSDLFGMLGSLTVPNIGTNVAPTSEKERLQQVHANYHGLYNKLTNERRQVVARLRTDPRARARLAVIDRWRTLYAQAMARTRTQIARAAGPPSMPPRDVKAYIRSLFTTNGLPASLADWAYGVLVEGATGTEMVQRMYDRPEFRERFKALFEYRKNFPNSPAISPAQVLEFERDGAAIMRAAGMPPQFYDHWSDFVKPISKGMSMGEFGERVQDVFMRVQTSPRGVRDAFASFFGPSGDAALAAMILDPDKALPALRQQVAAAEVAGAGFNFGFTIGRDTALEIGQSGFDFQSAQDRFANLVQIQPVFQELVGETDDFTVEDEGVDAMFGTEGAGAAQTAIAKRQEERTAAFGGGGGAAGSIEAGARGLGSARP